MTESLAASDWAASRGEKWRDHVAEFEAMLAPVDEPLIQALKLDTPCRIAEIGCGGGGTTLKLLRAAPDGSIVHGFDISPALVEFARQRKPAGTEALSFEVADMAITPPPAGPYQRLVSRFGIMFFENPQSSFTNLAAWLEPGGRFAFAVWGSLEENVWMTTVREAVAEVIQIPPADPQGPGPFRYANASDLLALLDRAGFGKSEVTNWTGELTYGGNLSPAEAAAFALDSLGNFAELLANAGHDARDRAHQSLTRGFAPFYKEGAVRMNACVHLVTGTRTR